MSKPNHTIKSDSTTDASQLNFVSKFERNRYPLPQILLHWVIVFLVIGVYTTGYSDNVGIHILIGYLVLILSVLRIILGKFYKKYRPPVLPKRLSRLAIIVNILFKISLAVFFILIPVLGILVVHYSGIDNHLAYIYLWLHAFSANIAFLFILFHSIFALYQHFVVKNDTLLRMSPH